MLLAYEYCVHAVPFVSRLGGFSPRPGRTTGVQQQSCHPRKNACCRRFVPGSEHCSARSRQKLRARSSRLTKAALTKAALTKAALTKAALTKSALTKAAP